MCAISRFGEKQTNRCELASVSCVHCVFVGVFWPDALPMSVFCEGGVLFVPHSQRSMHGYMF